MSKQAIAFDSLRRKRKALDHIILALAVNLVAVFVGIVTVSLRG